MTKGLRRKLLNMVKLAIEKKTYFQRVVARRPAWPLPDGAQTPAAFVFWMPSKMNYGTNEEKTGMLHFGVLGFVKEEEDLDLVKADCGDWIEEALEDMMKDSTFLQTAVQITVDRADPGPLALVELGINPGDMPPYGAVRVDGVIEYDYDAKS
jgi:hypothetical protein